jgi:hypothetical protein
MSGNYNIQIIGIFIGLVVVGILYGIGQIVKAKDKNKETFATTGQGKIVEFIAKNWILFLIIAVIIVIYFIGDVFFNRNTPVA